MLEFIIIGAGFAGAALAKALTDRGVRRITLLEQESGPGHHASGKNAAMLRQGVTELAIAQYIQVTRKLLLNPPSHWPNVPWFHQTGSLLLGAKAKLESILQNISAVGSTASLVENFPAPEDLPPIANTLLQQNPHQSLLFTPHDGVVEIRRYLNQLLQDAADQGADIHYNYRVDSLHWNGETWEVKGSGPNFSGRTLINAAGAWADEVATLAGIKPRELIPHRRHLFRGRIENSPNASGPLVWDVDRQVYYRNDGDGLLLSSGDETPQNPGYPQVDPIQEKELAKKIKAAFPYLGEISITDSWACLRTLSRSGLPELGQDVENKNFFWLGALGGHGMGTSWGLGKAAAQLLLGS